MEDIWLASIYKRWGKRDSCAGGIQNKEQEEKSNKGLLVGSGEYTLVYEDNEGDRMLVGDVPWQ